MAMYEKPGAGNGPRDRHTHYNDPYDRASREIRTIQKKIWGLDGLSKKERMALENSTNDRMAPKVSYSINKSKRWELCLSPEDFIEKMASLNQEYPVAAVDQSILKGEYTTNAYSQKLPNEELKSIKVKSGNGAPFLSLRDSLNEKNPSDTEKQRRIKGDTAKEYVETPSILYCIADHHSDELFFRRCIGKGNRGAWTSRKNKIVDLKDIEDEPSDVDSDFAEDFEPELPESPKTTSTLADFIVSKRTSKFKKRKNNHDFEIINELPKDKSPPRSPTLTHISELVQSSVTVTRFINIDTDYLQLPSFESFEFMFDFYWLNEEKTKCLFIVPKGSEDVLTSFNSILILELSQNARNNLIRMTVKSVHEIHLPSSSGNPEKAMSEIEVAIRKLWEQGITHLNKCKDEQSKLPPFYQPQTSIFSKFSPMGDYALLGGLSKSTSSNRTESESDDYEKVESESCNLCSHGRDGNLTTLKCGHTFCRYCSEKFIKEQIESGLPQHQQQLSCAKCSIPLESSFILVSTPLLLLQAYLRFQFLKQENTLECPSKCGVAFIEESPKFGGVHCSKCKICFCVKCKHEPHFPLTCDQMSLWETRFMPQYIAETRKSLSSSSENAELKEEDLMLSRWKINQALSYPYLAPRNKSLVDNEVRPMNVTSSIASVCIEARYKRMKTRYLKSLIKQFGKFSTTEKAKEFRYDLITALFLQEFCYAWIYFSRKYKSLEYKSIKQALYNLRGAFVEIESRLSTGNIEEAMEKLNLLKNLCKIIVEKF